MPRPASTSAQRHDSNYVLPPSYRDLDAAAKHASSAAHSSLGRNIASSETTVHASILQPRVAVALGLSAKWHPLLFICRLLSILPALWWGIPLALRLLAQVIVLVDNAAASYAREDRTQSIPWLREYSRIAPDLVGSDNTMDFETRLRMTEMALGIIWCSSSAYLSFTFTDCLMSRWLLLYTPQATLVRLLAINLTNSYLTSQVLYLTGGSIDPRIFLPAWITIATTLTGLYHVTQRKINIRKETRLSISVFSIASFISMVALLAAVQTGRPEWPRVPLMEGLMKVLTAVEAGRRKLGELGDRGKGEL